MKRVLVFHLPKQSDKPEQPPVRSRHLELVGLAVAVLLVAAMVALAGCNVSALSEESYRAALTKIKSNLDEQIKPSLENMKAQDLHSEAPQHTGTWWDAKIGLVADTSEVASAALSAKDQAAR